MNNQSNHSSQYLDTPCSASNCNKYITCKRWIGNYPEGVYPLQDYSTMGSGATNSPGIYYCGVPGLYKLYNPLEDYDDTFTQNTHSCKIRLFGSEKEEEQMKYWLTRCGINPQENGKIKSPYRLIGELAYTISQHI